MHNHVWLVASLISLTACGGGGDDSDGGSDNTAPTAEQLTISLNEDSTKPITLNGNDVDGDTLSYTVITPPTNGSLSGTEPNLTYIPNSNYHGSDSFTFKVNDGTVDSATATVSLSITPENDAPLAEAQAVNLLLNNTKAITLTGSDVDGDTLSYSIETQPTNGTLSGAAPNLSYTPNTNYQGSDSFTFKVSDGLVDSTTATVSLTITSTPVNNAPLADAQTVTLQEDSVETVTLTGSDADGDSLSYTIVTQPTNGTLSGTAPDLTYIPTANYNGSDSFTFKVNDGVDDSAAATIELTINPVNDAPIAENLTVSLDQDSSVAIALSGADVEGSVLTYTIQTQPTNGTLSGVAPDLTYAPSNGYTGGDSFTYTSHDGEQGSLSATVSITISPVSTMAQMPLNDTGITWGGDYPSGSNITCIGETITEQDCSHGRDVTHNDDSDGHAGFSFTKLDSSGNDLSASASSWSCVRDNVTGLIWEVKTTDSGLHHNGWSYTWYNSTGINDGGAAGTASGGSCGGTVATGCDTEKFVAAVNRAGLCGVSDWRMPSIIELRNLVNLNQVSPAIDTDYFPNTQNNWYWSSSPGANGSSSAWIVKFSSGGTGMSYRYGNLHVRLVRFGQ